MNEEQIKAYLTQIEKIVRMMNHDGWYPIVTTISGSAGETISTHIVDQRDFEG